MDDEIDRVPLAGVDLVKQYDENASIEQATAQPHDYYYLQIATNPEGYNSGRTYHLRTQSKSMHEQVVPLLSKFSKDARRRAESSTVFRKSQIQVKKIYERTVCQAAIAIIILGVSARPETISQFDLFSKRNSQSFVCTIVETDYGSGSGSSAILALLNFIFTVFFAFELGICAYAHWFFPFIVDPWSWLDIFVVTMSIVSLVVADDHTGFVRIMRAFRVIRLFSHIPALRKILSALALAIVPVLNVFMILLILACICELPRPHARVTPWRTEHSSAHAIRAPAILPVCEGTNLWFLMQCREP